MGSSKRWYGVVVLVLATAIARAGLGPLEVPFVVNTSTDGLQGAPAAAVAGDGAALVVWDSDDLGEGESEIAGRLIDAAGAPVGDEFQINTYTPNAQLRPAVEALGGGGFVVVWESYSFETAEDELGIRRLDAAGVPVGDEVAIDLTEFHYRPDVAEIGGGSVVVVWDDGFDVFGRRYDSAGAPIGDEFQVNAQSGAMSSARVASSAAGAFTVVWQDYRSEIDGDGDSVLMRRFESDGTPTSGDLQVNSTSEGDQYAPAIAMQGDGAFVVAWEAYGQEVAGDGAFGRVFDNTGGAVGGEFRVDSGASVYAGYVDAAAVDGGFAVVWNEPREEGGDVFSTMMRRLDTAGGAGAVIDVDPSEQGDQANGVVAGGDGGVLVAWQGFGLDDQDVFAQWFEVLDETPGAGTPTATADASGTPAATETPTVPAGECAGDCDGDGTVSISELVRAVNIALGTADLSSCVAADRDGDGEVAINELIGAVNAALQGCANA